MLHFLTTPGITSYENVAHDWSIDGLLDKIANADPPYHALIDSGALITGKTNLEVAQYLLEHGLKDMDGVVYLDSGDNKRVLVRDGMRSLDLSQSGIPKHRRFAFYDQIHTTGTDLKLPLNATGAITLGKFMTFRDYAQAAFRLRQIGQGQKLHILMIPEVLELVSANSAAGRGIDQGQRAAELAKLKSPELMERAVLQDVCTWLVVNAINSEKLQFNVCCEHGVQNVWRKFCFQQLQEHAALIGTPQATQEIKDFIDEYRDRIDFTVENTIRKPVRDQRCCCLSFLPVTCARKDKSAEAPSVYKCVFSA